MEIKIPTAKEIIVTAYPGYKYPASADIALQYFFDAVKGANINRHEIQIKRLRGIDKKANPSEYQMIKDTLPCISISAKGIPGKTSRKMADGHTGVICVDIDHGDNPHIRRDQWPIIRDILAQQPTVYFAALSAGGNGIFVLHAANPDAPHRAIFKVIEKIYFDKYNLRLDKQCGNPNRLRCLTYDPDAKISQPKCRLNCALINAAPSDGKVIHPHAKPRTRRICGANSGISINDRAAAAAEIFCRRRISLSYDDWYRAAAALHCHPDGYGIFDAISAAGVGYEGKEQTALKWEQTAKLTRIGLPTWLRIAAAHGITPHDIAAELAAHG